MKNRMTMERVASICAVAVAVLFAAASVLKIAAPALFAQQVKYYKILPLSAVNLTALLMPWWELAGAVALLIPRWRAAGAWIVLALTLCFTGAVISAMARGLDISCGCFAASSAEVGFMTLLLDVSLLLMTAVVIGAGYYQVSTPK